MNNVVPLLNEVERRLAGIAEHLPPEHGLKHSGGSGTSDGMDTVDAKIAAAEARTDTKFAELRGDLKDFATKTTVWQAVGTIIVSVLGVLLAVLAFGGDRFDGGLSVGGIISQVQGEQKARDQAQDAKLDEILKRLPPSKG